jgi:hypothetical protein
VRWLRSLPLLAACVLHAPALPAEPSADVQALRDCAARVSPTLPNGIETLRRSCPDIEQAMSRLGWREQLEEQWPTRINRRALADLAWLTERYQGQPRGPAPAVATARSVARGLRQTLAPQSWWQQLKARLLDWLRYPDSPGGSWLSQWLSRLRVPALLRIGFMLAAIAAVLIMAVWIIWREVKAARTSPNATDPSRRRSIGLQPLPVEGSPGLGALEAVTLEERPALMLRLLVRSLVRSGRLRAERSLTHRQLAVRSSFDDGEQRARFLGIALLAERQLYGAGLAEHADQAAIRQALMAGRRLYDELSVASAAQ